MAAPKKTSTTEKKTATKAPVKKTSAANSDPVQNFIELVRGFQMYTLVAMGLAAIFIVLVIVPDWRYVWELNIPFAGASGYLFWSQSNKTEGLEQKVCRWGLLAVVIIFLYRDVTISQKLGSLADFDLFN
ncbi:MAG: hypothetical protein V3R64_07565 [Sphingomonadales bacterium]